MNPSCPLPAMVLTIHFFGFSGGGTTSSSFLHATSMMVRAVVMSTRFIGSNFLFMRYLHEIKNLKEKVFLTVTDRLARTSLRYRLSNKRLDPWSTSVGCLCIQPIILTFAPKTIE